MFARFHLPGHHAKSARSKAKEVNGNGSHTQLPTSSSQDVPSRSPPFALHSGGATRDPLSPCRLGYLYSAPLVHKAGGQAKELDMQDGMHIDIGQELGRLKHTLHDAQRRILFRAEVATVKN